MAFSKKTERISVCAQMATSVDMTGSQRRQTRQPFLAFAFSSYHSFQTRDNTDVLFFTFNRSQQMFHRNDCNTSVDRNHANRA